MTPASLETALALIQSVNDRNVIVSYSRFYLNGTVLNR